MGWFTGIVVYLIIFWTALFAVLPWGNKPHYDENIGTAGSAPANPRILKKFLITAAISAMIWGVVYILIEIEIIDFYGIAEQMMTEDTAE